MSCFFRVLQRRLLTPTRPIRYQNWSLSGLAQLNEPSIALNVGVLPTFLRASLQDGLDSITCDGASILVPSYQHSTINSTVQALVFSWAAFGVVSCAALALLTVWLREHNTFKASSGWFYIFFIKSHSSLLSLHFTFPLTTLHFSALLDDDPCGAGHHVCEHGLHGSEAL